MRKGKVLKILVIMLVVLLAISVFVPQSNGYDWAGKITTFDTDKDMGGIKGTTENIVGAIITVIRIVAVGVAIIMICFVAMKYMSSAPGDRAEIKKHAVIYVVGAIVLFGASGILTIIQKFANEIK